MITVKNLSKAFGEITAVDDLSFKIKKGEIVGFLGPNGAGKTTTMRLLTGYLTADSGSVEIDGHNISTDLEACQSLIGYLPENNPLYKNMLVAEMFELSADLKRIPQKQRNQAFDFAVAAVSIEDVYYRQISELSKGYRQRVGMALALMHRPKVIIMDEPTEGLDPNQRSDIRSLIKQLSKDRTIILSTHVMQEAVALSNRILIINRGKLIADGSPESLTQSKADGVVLSVELEGANIAPTLKKHKDVFSVSSTKTGPKRYRLDVTFKKDKPGQPVISALATKNGWTIWDMSQKQTNLEDVFHQLTQGKHESK